MEKRNYSIESSSNERVDVNYYETENPKALIQILHGMQEHKERYDDFASFLCEHGYNVVVHDHLGHGKSISQKHPLGDMVSFDCVVKDIDLVRQSTNFTGTYYLLGHSMGSFLARVYSSLYPVEKLVLSGTGEQSNVVTTLLKLVLAFNKPGVPLPKIQDMTLGPMGKKFEDPTMWLSYNEENRKKYAQDPLCGVPFTKEGYSVLADIVKNMNKPDTYKNNTAKKILLVSGEKDPVGDDGKGIMMVADKYKKYNKDVDYKLYKNMTHEILNETDKQVVYDDLLAYFDN